MKDGRGNLADARALAALEAAMARKRNEIEALQADLRALEQARAVLQGHHAAAPSVAPNAAPARPRRGRPPATSPTLVTAAAAILRSAGTPLPLKDLIARLRATGVRSSRNTIASSLYRASKARQTVVATGPGTFGLLEWQAASAPASSRAHRGRPGRAPARPAAR